MLISLTMRCFSLGLSASTQMVFGKHSAIKPFQRRKFTKVQGKDHITIEWNHSKSKEFASFEIHRFVCTVQKSSSISRVWNRHKLAKNRRYSHSCDTNELSLSSFYFNRWSYFVIYIRCNAHAITLNALKYCVILQ